MLNLRREQNVFVLTMDDGENRFRPEGLARWNEALDEVEAAGKPAALVTTGTGKFYSNGLDLDWLLGEGKDHSQTYIPNVLALIARVLTFPAITVAAMNGHAFGAGAQLAVAHDYRVMRSDRGYFCMPEIDMGIPLHPGMTAVLQARLPHQSAHEVLVTGRRYGGVDALERRIVDHAVSEAEVLPRAIDIAASLADKAHPVMRTIKRELYPRTLEALALPMSAVPQSGSTFS